MKREAALAAALLLLCGCSDLGEITGIGVGGATGAATANPALGYAVGIGTAAAADSVLNYIARSRQNGTQDAIVTAASGLAAGEGAPWHIDHDIPIGNAHGQVRVVRDIDTPLAACKELVFSVEDPPQAPAWFTSPICRDTRQWKWAQAEPAVVRWDVMQ